MSVVQVVRLVGRTPATGPERSTRVRGDVRRLVDVRHLRSRLACADAVTARIVDADRPDVKRSPIKRKTRLRSKRPTARRKAPPAGCASRGCPATRVRVIVSPTERYCDKHGTKKADDAARAFVRARDPVCVACRDRERGVQWAHIHTRGMRYIRWDADNAVGLCANCHFAYTKRPAAWVKFVESKWPGRWVRLLHRELWGDSLGGSVDVAEVIRTYRSREPWMFPDPPPEWAPEEV